MRPQNFARKLRREATRAERYAWQLLRRRQMLGLRFVRQKCLHGFIVDFYCAELKLAIELDGEVHDSTAAKSADAERSARLANEGVRVVRLRNNQVRPDILRQSIASHIVSVDEIRGR